MWKEKKKKVACGLYIIVYSLTLFTAIVIVQISVQQCPYALQHQEDYGSLGWWLQYYNRNCYIYPYGPGFEIDYVWIVCVAIWSSIGSKIDLAELYYVASTFD